MGGSKYEDWAYRSKLNLPLVAKADDDVKPATDEQRVAEAEAFERRHGRRSAYWQQDTEVGEAEIVMPAEGESFSIASDVAGAIFKGLANSNDG